MKKLFDEWSEDCSESATKKYSTSFSLAVRTLAPEIRADVYNVYGFVRLADEIVDSFHGYDKEAILNEFEKELYLGLSRKISINPILNSFQNTVHKYNIPEEHIAAFMKSMRADLAENNYESEEAYHDYIYGSADVVGLMCLRIFVKGDQQKYDELVEPARRLGSAFQKVNFLRDFRADTQGLERSYFPNLDSGELTEAKKGEIIADIQLDFDAAFLGVKGLPKDARFGVYLAFKYYVQLLQALSRATVEAIRADRIRVSDFKKTILLATLYIRNKLNLL